MKTLKLVTFLTVIAVISSTSLLAQHTPISFRQAGSPEAVLTEFYKFYIHAGSQDIDPFKKDMTTLRKYVTGRFIQEIERNETLPEGEGFDADYFLQTQDPLPSSDSNNEAEWLKSMVVSNVKITGTTATAIVSFFRGYPKVKVTLIRERGAWKINRVRNAP